MPLPAGVRVVAAATIIVFAGSVAYGTEAMHLPNLVPEPPSEIIVGTPDPVEEPEDGQPIRALRFATTTFNRGDYPLELTFVPASIEDVFAGERDIRQCVRFQTLDPRLGPACSSWIPAGRAVYHEPHQHWHVDDYATYELLPVTQKGGPDFDAPPIAPGAKASFCLVDSERADDARDSDRPTPTRTLLNCNHTQGITQRHGDRYGNSIFGQQIVIDDIEPGVYALVIVVNPIARLHETTRSDNRSWAVIDLRDVDDCHRAVPILSMGVS